jgi:tetratricopeptide (TPR) repeat protein
MVGETPNYLENHMKWLACALFVLSVFAARPAEAQGDDVIKGAFIMCGVQHVLVACDDLVKMPDMNDVVRSNAYGTRAATLAQMGRIGEAQRDLDTALKLNPDNQDVKRFKALLLGATSSPGASAGGADKATLEQCQTDADVSVRLKACDAVIAAKRNDAPAVQAAAYDLRAAAFLEAGQYAKSLGDLDTADRLAPNREGAAAHRIQVMTEAGDYPKALATVRAALDAAPVSDVDLLHEEAELLYLTGDRASAVKIYDSIYRAHTDYVMAKYWGAIIRLELRQDAAADLRDLLGNSMMSPLGAAIIHWRLRDGGRDAVLREAQLSGPDASCIAYFNLGHDAWLRGDLTEARVDLQQAVATRRIRLTEYRGAKLILSRL